MADITFIFHSEWLDAISKLPQVQQDKIIADLVRFGCDKDLGYVDAPEVNSYVEILKGRIAFSKEKYQEKVSKGEKYGAKKRVQSQRIYELAREGKGSAEIAAILGVSKSTVDHSEGWAKRKTDGIVFE